MNALQPFVPPSARELLEQEIERLIALLDAIDGDPDLEPSADLEPSLGYGRLFDDRGWRFTTEDLEGHDASDEGDVSYSAVTMNPRPIRTRQIRR